MIKFPKDDRTYSWTSHIKNKLVFYRLSPNKIRTIVRSNDRKEEGIAPHTIAVMKRNDTSKRPEELWVMYQRRPKSKSKFILISAWRYPGVSKPGKQIPIPEDILEEIEEKWF